MRRHINRYGRMPSSAESSASDDDDGSNGSVPSSVGGSPSSSSTSSQTQPSSCFSFPSQSLPEDVEHSSASSFSSERDNVDDRLSDRSDSDEDLSTRPLYGGCPIDVRTFLVEIFMWKAKHKGTHHDSSSIPSDLPCLSDISVKLFQSVMYIFIILVNIDAVNFLWRVEGGVSRPLP